MTDGPGRVRRSDQELGRHATDSRACGAGEGLVDEQRPDAVTPCMTFGRQAGRTRADHGDIACQVTHSTCPPGPKFGAASMRTMKFKRGLNEPVPAHRFDKKRVVDRRAGTITGSWRLHHQGCFRASIQAGCNQDQRRRNSLSHSKVKPSFRAIRAPPRGPEHQADDRVSVRRTWSCPAPHLAGVSTVYSASAAFCDRCTAAAAVPTPRPRRRRTLWVRSD